MDRFIASWPSQPDGDLRLCIPRGVAYQADMTPSVAYDANYLAKVDAYDGSPIAKKVNAGRCAMLLRHVPGDAAVLDVGAGSGAFVRCARGWGLNAFGFDVIPQAVERLREAGVYADDFSHFEAVTLWDVLEHMEDPGACVDQIRVGAFAFCSIPVFRDFSRIRESKHYRPGEHLTYWSPAGFEHWMEHHGFRLIEDSDHEVKAGRESIGAYAFVRESK